MKHIFNVSLKVEMSPVSNDETKKERILREQAQARLDAWADGVAQKITKMLQEDERVCEHVEALDREWKKLTRRGAIRFVEF